MATSRLWSTSLATLLKKDCQVMHGSCGPSHKEEVFHSKLMHLYREDSPFSQLWSNTAFKYKYDLYVDTINLNQSPDITGDYTRALITGSTPSIPGVGKPLLTNCLLDIHKDIIKCWNIRVGDQNVRIILYHLEVMSNKSLDTEWRRV